MAVEVHIDKRKRLEEQLDKSRIEIAVWVNKYSDLEREVKKLYRLKDILLNGKELLEKQVEELKELLREKEAAISEGNREKLTLVKV